MKPSRPSLSLGSLRGWHLWVSIALSLPILIVSVTAIFIAHGKSLGLKEMQVPAGWLPGMQAGKAEAAEPRAHWQGADGRQWLGTKGGLFLVQEGQVRRVEDLGRAEVRDVQGDGRTLVVATQRGLWRVDTSEGAAERLARGDFWSVSQAAEGWRAVDKGGRVWVSRDAGRSWSEDAVAVAGAEQVAASLSQAATDAGGEDMLVPMNKLVMDLHTGKAFLGKTYEWIWIDLVGAAMTLLTVSGLLMWWRGQRRKVAALEAQLKAALQTGAQAARPEAVVVPAPVARA
jgi:hypothetical protein